MQEHVFGFNLWDHFHFDVTMVTFIYVVCHLEDCFVERSSWMDCVLWLFFVVWVLFLVISACTLSSNRFTNKGEIESSCFVSISSCSDLLPSDTLAGSPPTPFDGILNLDSDSLRMTSDFRLAQERNLTRCSGVRMLIRFFSRRLAASCPPPTANLEWCKALPCWTGARWVPVVSPCFGIF